MSYGRAGAWGLVALLVLLSVGGCTAGDLKRSAGRPGAAAPNDAAAEDADRIPDADPNTDAARETDAALPDAEARDHGVADVGARDADASDTGAPDAAPADAGLPELPQCTDCVECADGIDNDGDGLVDWGYDLGCTSVDDPTEGGLPSLTLEHSGWPVFEPHANTEITYVSPSGNDRNRCGAGPLAPKRNLSNALDSCLVDGQPHWILIESGADYSATPLNFDESGLSPEHPILIGTYHPGGIPGPRARVGRKSFSTNNVAVVDLDLGSHVYSFFINGSSGITFAGNIIQNADTAGTQPVSYINGPDFRFIGNWVGPSGETGVFIGRADGVLNVSRNVFYRNAVHPRSANHAIYAARSARSYESELPYGTFNHNFVYQGDVLLPGEYVGVGDKTNGNGLIIRFGPVEATGNVGQSVGWAMLATGVCNDNGDRGVCGQAPCAACLRDFSVRDLWHQDHDSSVPPDYHFGAGGDYVRGGRVQGLCGHNVPGHVDTPRMVSTSTRTIVGIGLEEWNAARGGAGTTQAVWSDIRDGLRYRNTSTRADPVDFLRYIEDNTSCDFVTIP
jgi:hypothetical protein